MMAAAAGAGTAGGADASAATAARRNSLSLCSPAEFLYKKAEETSKAVCRSSESNRNQYGVIGLTVGASGPIRNWRLNVLRRWSWSFWSKLELDIKSASALELLNQIGLSKTSYIPWVVAGSPAIAAHQQQPHFPTHNNGEWRTPRNTKATRPVPTK